MRFGLLWLFLSAFGCHLALADHVCVALPRCSELETDRPGETNSPVSLASPPFCGPSDGTCFGAAFEFDFSKKRKHFSGSFCGLSFRRRLRRPLAHHLLLSVRVCVRCCALATHPTHLNTQGPKSCPARQFLFSFLVGSGCSCLLLAALWLLCGLRILSYRWAPGFSSWCVYQAHTN